MRPLKASSRTKWLVLLGVCIMLGTGIMASAMGATAQSSYLFHNVDPSSVRFSNCASNLCDLSFNASSVSSTTLTSSSTTSTATTASSFSGEYYWDGTDATHLPDPAWNEPQPFYSAGDAIAWANANLPACTGYILGVWTTPEGNLGNVAGEMTPCTTTTTAYHNLVGVQGVSGQEPSIVVWKGLYDIVYDVNTANGGWETYVAQGSDGLTFTNPTLILTGYNNEDVVQAGNHFDLFAVDALTQNAIYEWACSGVWNCSLVNGGLPVLTTGPPGSWDWAQIHNTGGYYNSTTGTVTLLFDGDNATSIYSSIDLAYQTVANGTFTALPSPVIVGAGVTNQSETGGFLAWGGASNLVRQGSTWYVLANAEPTTTSFGVYLLSSPNLETWSVVGLVVPGATDPFVVFTPTGASVYVTDSGIRFISFSSQAPTSWLWVS
jgi:hypothetical protein